jgi:hypothetical protein
MYVAMVIAAQTETSPLTWVPYSSLRRRRVKTQLCT